MFIWKEPTYKLVDTKERLDLLCQLIQENISNDKPIAIDVETTGVTDKSGLDPYHGWLLGIGIALGIDEGYYIPIKHTKKGILRKEQLPLNLIVDKLNSVVSTGGVWLMHNSKFDYKFLWQAGIYLYPNFWDTMIAIKMLNGDTKQTAKLKDVIKQYVDIPYTKLIKTFKDASQENAAEQDPVQFGSYCIDDVIYTYYLYKGMKPQIDKQYRDLFYNAEALLTPILAQMEMRGIMIDVDFYEKAKIPLVKCRDKMTEIFETKYKTNVASPKQVGELLKKYAANNELMYTRTNLVQTDVEALQTIQRRTKNKKLHKLAGHILFHRGINKALTTYIDKYPKVAHQHFLDDEKIEYILHTNFDQIKNSGRLSSSPNIQNITRDNNIISIRKGFVAREGYNFIEADWSGCELRMVAIASKDKKMLDAFINDPRHADLHTTTADAMNVIRHIGKTINFSIIYGATEYSISKTLNCSKERAKEYLNMFFRVYPGVLKWKQRVEKDIIKNGYTKTFYGRRRYLPYNIYPEMREKWKWEGAVRELTNHIIQGTSADLLKYSMVKITRKFAELNLDAHLITTTHDSVVVEAKEGLEEQVKDILLSCMNVTIDNVLLPVDIEVKKNFAKVKK